MPFTPHRTIDRRTLLAGSVATAAIATLGAPSLASAGPGTAPLAQIDDGWKPALEAVMEIVGIAGAAVYFGQPDDEPWQATLGVADLETGAVITGGTHFRIGSVTKTFVATVILQLVDEGRLTLETTIDTFDSPVQNAPFITIRNLLNMTSGLGDYTHVPTFLELVLAAPERSVSPDELIAFAATLPSGLPGDAYAYSNTNYIILGRIIEELTGQALHEVLTERLFAPLGMTQTALQASETLPEPFARGYGRAEQVGMFVGMDDDESEALADLATPLAGPDGVIDFTQLNPSFAWAAGGAYSIVDDLTRWLPALVNGTLVSEAMQRERLTLQPVNGFGSGGTGGYGLGVGAFGEALGHSGTIPGYSTFAVMDRRTGHQQIVLTNLSGGGGAEVAAQLFGEALRSLFGLGSLGVGVRG